MDPYLSAVYYFAGNFAMKGFALCEGQILSIQQNTALFSLVGTYYGGNGTSNFGLPDLRGRVGVGQGNGPGLSSYSIGEFTGTENNTMSVNQMPSHTHNLNAYNLAGDSNTPAGTILSKGPSSGSGPSAKAENFYNTTSPPNTTMYNNSISFSGGGQPFNIIQPVLAISCVIALSGIYPARN